MIGKVITLKKSGPARGGFREAVQYLTRSSPDDRNASPEPIASSDLGVVNLDTDLDTPDDLKNVWSSMNVTALRSRRFKGNPVYHVSLSWQEHEHPDRKQVEHAVLHVMNTLGMAECEAIWAIHRDTANDHVHLVINRVHPDRAIVMGPPRFDYFLIDHAMRELEIAQGWTHDPGPHVVHYLEDAEPEIKRLSRSERRARGILKDAMTRANKFPDPDVRVEDSPPPISQRAYRAAHNQGAPSFQEWIAGVPAEALVQALQAPDACWAKVHQVLSRYGMKLAPKGSGLVVTTVAENRVLAAKASQLGRWASKAALEKKLGPFEPPTILEIQVAEYGYAQFLDACQRGEIPLFTTPHEDIERTARRELRAEARRALHERFKLEQELLRSSRNAERSKLQKRHRQERESFRETNRERRSGYITTQKAAGIHPKLAASLRSFSVAQEREVMQKRHAMDRAKLRRLPGSQVWREWLTDQAERGDQAAQAALLGIRYQEQRKKSRTRNGIEGEDLAPMRPVLAGLKTEVDHKNLRIHYLSVEGRALFTDMGSRIDVHDKTDATLEAALRVAAQKFGGSVAITGSIEFREQTAIVAARLGIGVTNAELRTNWEIARKHSWEQTLGR
jgi:hypothetical protein